MTDQVPGPPPPPFPEGESLMHHTPRERTVSGVERIALERKRQIDEEGYDAEHDAEHKTGQLASLAALYALPPFKRQPDAGGYIRGTIRLLDLLWPRGWSKRWWKPDDDRIRELEKAGALIAAEIDRLLAEEEQINKQIEEFNRGND